MKTPFSTSELLRPLSNYPVAKGGPGSGRHPEGTGRYPAGVNTNGKITDREEMVRIDTDIAEKYYKFQGTVADKMVAEERAAMYAKQGVEVKKEGYGKQQRTVYTTVTGEQMVNPKAFQLIEARLAGKFGEFPEKNQYGSPRNYKEDFDKSMAELEKTKEARDTARAVYEEADSHYEGWNRYFGVQDGHIHSSMECHSCNNGITPTSFVWLPRFSGLTEEEAVAQGGSTLCTHCFPTAPVEWTSDTFSTARVAGDLHIRADFAGQDISGKDFTEQRGKESDFSGAKLIGTNFTKAYVPLGSFRGADLTDANLTKVNAEQANFSNATLVNANLSGAKLEGANFQDADLSGANLARMKPFRASFDGANLQGVRTAASAKGIGGTDIRNTTFESADLRNADLRGFEANSYGMKLPSFAMADLSGSTFADPKVNDKGFTADYRGELKADFSGANLSNVNFAGREIGGKFIDANLTNANFAKVKLDGRRDQAETIFNGADLAFANIEGANLVGADFTGARNLDKIQGEPARQISREPIDREFMRTARDSEWTNDANFNIVIGDYLLPEGYGWSSDKGIFKTTSA